MPSPFPGMDPWLERAGVFPDLHDSLIFLLRGAINDALPEGYMALGNQMVWIDDEQRRIPDLGTFGPDDRWDGEVGPELFAHTGSVAVAADFMAEPWEQSYLEIRNAEDERLVTALEILSPKNKKSGDAGREAYLQKQAEFRRGGVHLVEIDLLRGGMHTTAIPLRDLKRVKPEFDYHHCVTVCGERTRFEVNAYSLKDSIPPIVIPLDPGVRPIKIELQPLFDRAYDTGRSRLAAKYAKRIPEPPLSEEQRVWAEQLLSEYASPRTTGT